MERAQRLIDLWTYLPAFRAVGETEHLPSAAARIGLTPSALSRAVSALEAQLGQRLFRRQRGRLVLDEPGRELLVRVRDAMRLVDDGVDAVLGEALGGPLRVASTSQLGTTLVVPALLALRRAHPHVRPELVDPPAAVEAELSQGRVDLVLTEAPLERRGLRVAALGEFSNGVWCGPGHPLHGLRRVGLARLADHGFVAPPAPGGRPLDDWPPERPRRVDVRVHQMLTALQACATGGALAVLPDRVVALHGEGRRLRRLVVTGLRLRPSALYAITRRPLGPQDRADAVLRLLLAGARPAAPPRR